MAMPTVNSVGAVIAGAGAITVAPGASHTADDIDVVLLECSDADTAALTTANGFARLTALDQVVSGGAASTGRCQMSVWWRRWNGTDGSPVFADPGDHQVGRMISISGCKTTGDPWNVLSTGTTDSTQDTSLSAAGATTTAANCLVLAMACQGLPDAVSTTEFGTATNTDLANLAEQFDNSTNAGDGGAIWLVTGEKASAGAYGATTLTTATSSKRVCATLALEGVGGTGHTANPTDPEGLVDTTAQVADYAPGQTDPLGFVDTAAQVADYLPEPTDLLGLLDSATQVTDHFRDLTDNLGLLDDITVEATGSIDRTVTDPLGIVDAGQVDIHYPADPIGLTDPGTAELTREADNLGLTDSVSYVFDGSQAQTFTDPLGIVSSGTADIYYEADPLALADEATQVADYQRTVTDPVGLTDTTELAAVNHTATITDSLGLVDSAAAAAEVNVTITDLLGLVDSRTATATYLPTLTDLLGLTDSIISQLVGIDFWNPDPAGYTPNPVGYTKNPAAYVPVGAGDTPPWP